jgi:hypothetical protein
VLQGKLVQRTQRQGRENSNPLVQQPVGFLERKCDFGLAAGRFAGSGIPQCAVMGWPGQTGHVSAAALSQTVNTKSNFGSPFLANSSHDFQRKPETS